MHKIALIGYGRWGQILLPHLKKYFDVVSIFGRSVKRDGLFTNRLDEALESDVEAAVIATPITTHYKITRAALLNDRHVFCEKPLAMTLQEAKNLVDLATFLHLHLVTDYTYTFSKRLQEACDRLNKGQLWGMSLSLERNLKEKEDVYWVLISHLVAILGMFTDLSRLKFEEDLGNTEKRATIFFSGDIEGMIFANMEAAEKRTEISLYIDKKVLEFNDLLKDDNLGYAVEYFRDVLDGNEDESDNLELALSVTSVLSRLQLN